MLDATIWWATENFDEYLIVLKMLTFVYFLFSVLFFSRNRILNKVFFCILACNNEGEFKCKPPFQLRHLETKMYATDLQVVFHTVAN